MSIQDTLRTWWQRATGEEETPFDGDSPAWAVSLLVHLVLLLVVSSLSLRPPPEALTLTLTSEDDRWEPPEEFYFRSELVPRIGADDFGGVDPAVPAAPTISDESLVRLDTELASFDAGPLLITEEPPQAVGPLEHLDCAIQGVAGVGVTGAGGAIDRITHEILLSLEERDTVVVWLFDQSASLARQRDEIRHRFRRMYEELGLIQSTHHAASRQRLLTSIVAFGQQMSWPVKKPTADVEAIQSAADGISLDESGIENAFSTIYEVAHRFRYLRMREPKRNVMIIAVTDEVGDDYVAMLDRTVELCRRFAIPVYVIGVPAPFGQVETQVKWVDPDPRYDQTPGWGRVNQGPESLMPERLQLPFAGAPEEPIDSGFGPFALTRLCYETGGIYFALHSNRNSTRPVRPEETVPFSSYLMTFFDPGVMRPYRPDYVSVKEYVSRLQQNAARAAVVDAARRTVTRMEPPTLRFVKRSEAEFASALTEAQKAAAKLEPKLNQLHDILARGESDREREDIPRWQAAYDLAMGQLLAVLVRTRCYNEMLAMAKRGLAAKNADTNTWVLVPDKAIHTGSRLRQQAEKAELYLRRVAEEHPGTPWAQLATRELQVPLGWKWNETVTALAQDDRRPPVNANNIPTPPADEQPRIIQQPPPRRPIPRL